ncbi:hypothetical protein GCM10017673_03840 [Streptosporangium violaceochromogenes]|nr:hypothetical protein GCM10017673_03840 [Streptosporangium violaceochromogenes]
MTRILSSTVALVACAMGAMAGAAGTAHADSVNLTATVNPRAEVFLSRTLTPTAPYKGHVLVKLENNSQPTRVKVSNCRGRRIGMVAIPANDHDAHVVSGDLGNMPARACIRFRLRNVGDEPVTVAGAGYF